MNYSGERYWNLIGMVDRVGRIDVIGRYEAMLKLYNYF